MADKEAPKFSFGSNNFAFSFGNTTAPAWSAGAGTGAAAPAQGQGLAAPPTAATPGAFKFSFAPAPSTGAATFGFANSGVQASAIKLGEVSEKVIRVLLSWTDVSELGAYFDHYHIYPIA
jgi:hypothetical protein